MGYYSNMINADYYLDSQGIFVEYETLLNTQIMN